MTPPMLKNLIVVLMEKLKTMFEGYNTLSTPAAIKFFWEPKQMFFYDIFSDFLLTGTLSLRTNKNVLKIENKLPIVI